MPAGPGGAREETSRNEEAISRKSRDDLGTFIGRSVTAGTRKKYDRHWSLWKEFLFTERGSEDPFLKGMTDKDKSATVAMFLMRRHEAGHRGKSATAVTAGVRLRFAQVLESTDFLNASVIATTRHSCNLDPVELRIIRSAGASETVKLPVCDSILHDMRDRLWNGQDWDRVGLDNRMSYLGCVWGFDQCARVCEYTRPEPGALDHCVRVDDLSFFVLTEGVVKGVSGSQLAGMGLIETMHRVVECRARAATSKAKIVVKAKLIARRSVEESQFLEDLVLFIVKSGSEGEDYLFSYRRADGRSISLWGNRVRQEIKDACELRHLPPTYFSSHSLRKASITAMRSAGVSEDDRRDRGNYAPGSQVMNDTYDYSSGMGPLAANSLEGGRKVSVSDIQRLIPIPRGSKQQVKQGALGRSG